MVVNPTVEKAALAEIFWENLSPATKELLNELVEADSWDSLAKKWGYCDGKGARFFVQKQLRRRLENEGALKWLILFGNVHDS